MFLIGPGYISMTFGLRVHPRRMRDIKLNLPLEIAGILKFMISDIEIWYFNIGAFLI